MRLTKNRGQKTDVGGGTVLAIPSTDVASSPGHLLVNGLSSIAAF